MKVFEVGFRCNNCGNVWAKQFEADDRVTVKELHYVVVFKKSPTMIKDYIECPICEADDIQVISRIPLKDKNRYATSIPEE
jgi:rubredoxin